MTGRADSPSPMEPWLGWMFHGSVTGWHRGSNLPVSLAPCQVLVLVRDIWEMLGTKMLHEAGRPLWTVPNRRIRTTGARPRQPPADGDRWHDLACSGRWLSESLHLRLPADVGDLRRRDTAVRADAILDDDRVGPYQRFVVGGVGIGQLSSRLLLRAPGHEPREGATPGGRVGRKQPRPPGAENHRCRARPTLDSR